VNRKHWLPFACIAACLLLVCTQRSAAEQAYRVLIPTGRVPHPAVLLVPGCSGFATNNGINHYEERAAALQAAGFVVVFVDFVKKRWQSNCAHISLEEVAADITEAATWVRGQPDVDGARISVIGWSYGAGGVLAALKDTHPPIAKAVLYYPVCSRALPWFSGVSVLMLLGEKDDVAYPSLCKPVVDGVPAERLRVITYANARHGFDIRGLPAHAQSSGAPAYDAEAAEASWTAAMDFLR
jgi:dienelactone hydrolase